MTLTVFLKETPTIVEYNSRVKVYIWAAFVKISRNTSFLN